MRYKDAILRDLEACEQLQANLAHQIKNNQITPQEALDLLRRLQINLQNMRDKLELE